MDFIRHRNLGRVAGILALFVTLLLPAFGWAEAPPKPKPLHPVAAAALMEGLFAVNAAMATAAPEAYGGLMILVSPFASTGDNTTVYVTGIAGIMALGSYNAFELSRDRYSDGDRFRNNMIAWHLFMIPMGLVTHWTREGAEDAPEPATRAQEAGWRSNVAVTPGGVMLMARRPF